MGKTWALITHLHALAGPSLTLIYPLYASICAMESATRVDDEQWLAYWIIYSFITLFEMAAENVLYWIPLRYEAKLLLAAWLVLPHFRGASFIYDRFVREQLRKNGVRLRGHHHGHAADHVPHVFQAEHRHGVHS
ncbi:Protein HVA22 [Zea mays]|uniref:HVA22-like protein n=1 Tax=Zea mays TaxID=4577 RepID=A0A3L6FX36_MAIZE|nr:Protein HVA22 [Zea mays]